MKKLYFILYIFIIGCSEPSDVTYKSDAYELIIPDSWGKKDPKEFGYDDADILIMPEEDISLFIVIGQRYIEEIPDGIKTYNDWHKLQFDLIDKAEAQTIERVTIGLQEATKVSYLYSSDNLEAKNYHYVGYYFNRYLENHSNNRLIYIILAYAKNVDKKYLQTVDDIISSFSIYKYEW